MQEEQPCKGPEAAISKCYSRPIAGSELGWGRGGGNLRHKEGWEQVGEEFELYPKCGM